MDPKVPNRPIAVFDAGIGSYAIVSEIKRKLPLQDIVYFADRASFPYGNKNLDELAIIMKKTLKFLEQFSPSAIVIASNAPSITVLESLRNLTEIPLFGVFPPVEEALIHSNSKSIGIMGVKSLIDSEMLINFVNNCSNDKYNVKLINASSMVDLVESGEFLFNPEVTQEKVNVFMSDLFIKNPDLDVLTLSSTHLPWLQSFFENSRPQCTFLDPAKNIVANLGVDVKGTGLVKTFVTEGENYSADDFRCMLDKLGVKLSIEVI